MSFVERCRQRHLGSEGGDEGFTLIELLVVLLIIGILLAIAIPTFLSVTKGANNEAAQSNLTTALTGAKTYYTDSNQTYTGLTTSATNSTIQSIDTGLSYVSGANSTGNHVVSVYVNAAGTSLVMVAWAPGTNDCWGILDNSAAQGAEPINLTSTAYEAVGTWYFVVKGAAIGACKATATGPTPSTSAPIGIALSWPAG